MKIIVRLCYTTLTICLLTISCNRSGIEQDFSKLETGMTADQVIVLVGEPTEKVKLGESKIGTIEIWHYADKHAVQLLDGKIDRVILDFEGEDKAIKEMIHKKD